MEDAGPGTDPTVDDLVLDDHLSRHPAQDAPAEPDDPLEAVHEARQEAAPPDHDGEGEPDAEGDQHKVAVRGSGHSQDVVETHDDIGHDDDPDGLPQCGPLPDLVPPLSP